MADMDSVIADRSVMNVDPASTATARNYSRAYQRYALGIFFLGATLSFADQQMIVILVEPIKREFGASDTQMGLLTGFMFVLFYAVLSMPIARLADRGSRRNILAIAMAVWSLMTVFCGLSANFWQLAAARFGVGVGEAGGGPASHSMLADYFPPERRGAAYGVIAAAPPLGVLISLCGGALIATHFGWRSAFFMLGIPGIVLAMIVRLTIDEPRRGQLDAPQSLGASGLRMRDVVRQLWRDPAIRALALASSATSISTFAVGAWMPSFFIRVHGFSLMEAGIALGIGGTLGGIAGSIAGGLLADRLSARDLRWQLRVSALGGLLSLPAQLLVLVWPRGTYFALGAMHLPVVFVLVPIWTFFLALLQGPAAAAVQNLTAPAIRTQMTAAFFFLTTALGMGLGPLFVGAISDALAPAVAENSMRYGLLASLVFLAIGILMFWRASGLYAAKLSRRVL